jgi:hypothetical protein
MESTSTMIPYWKGDCVAFARNNQPFKLMNVMTDEHHRFCWALTASYKYRFELEGKTTAKFEPVVAE